MIAVDHGIPIPQHHREGPSAAWLYPFKAMAIGDSFLFPPDKLPERGRAVAASAGKRLGRKFITRKTQEGLRCWRIA